MSGIAVSEKVSLNTSKRFQFETWSDVVSHFRTNQENRGVGDSGKAKNTLLWGVPEGDSLAEVLVCAAGWYDGSIPFDKNANDITCWLNEQCSGPLSLESTLAATGVASVLPQLILNLSQKEFVELLDSLLEFQKAASKQDDRIVNQAAHELGLALAVALPEFSKTQEVGAKSFEVWIEEVDDLLDVDGAISAEYCSSIPTLLAVWTRCFQLSQCLEKELDDDTQQQWEWFVRYSMRLLRKNGTTMLADPSIPYQLDLYKAAVRTSSDKDDKSISRLVLPGGNPKKKKTEMFAENGTFSEWAGLGVMQPDWSPASPRLAIAVQDQAIRVEVCRGKPLFELTGLPDISINGKALMAVGEWEEVCSHFDDDVDYLELEIPLEDEVRLQRQISLVHDDELFLIADAVYGKDQERIDYQGQFRFSQEVSGLQETENNEVYLQRKKIVALAVPLGISEWQGSSNDGRLSVESGCLILDQSCVGKTLYAPMVFHVNPAQSVKPRTWRQLVVAESLEQVSDDVARAFRVRIGNQQWVMYKTFGETGNRTFLGQNQTSDFFMGRFQQDGNVEELIALEP